MAKARVVVVMAVEERAEKVVARVMAAAAMVRVVVAKARVVVVRVVAAEAKVTVAREAGACETRGAPAHHAEIQTDGGDNVQQWLQDNPSHAMASQSLALCYSNRHRACLPAASLKLYEQAAAACARSLALELHDLFGFLHVACCEHKFG